MAVDIVDQSVGKIPSVGGSILVSESEDMVHGVGVDLAIASSVLGCMVRVRRMLGCGGGMWVCCPLVGQRPTW